MKSRAANNRLFMTGPPPRQATRRHARRWASASSEEIPLCSVPALRGEDCARSIPSFSPHKIYRFCGGPHFCGGEHRARFRCAYLCSAPFISRPSSRAGMGDSQGGARSPLKERRNFPSGAVFAARRKRSGKGISELAGTAGLEPAHEGVKVPCLTAWLRPHAGRK